MSNENNSSSKLNIDKVEDQEHIDYKTDYEFLENTNNVYKLLKNG